MKFIILAAGRGERLWPLTKDMPKPLVDVGGGVTLLDQQLDRLRESRLINEVVIVTGYLGHKVDEKVIGLSSENLKIKTVFNPFYKQSNNLASLWMAQHEMGGDFMVTNGDNLFNKKVFSDFSEGCSEDGVYLSLGRKDSFDGDDMKVTLEDGFVTEVAKDIDLERCHAESPGLCLVRGAEARIAFKKALRSELETETGMNAFWLRAFTRLNKDGFKVKPWFFDADKRWREVDIHPDIDQMREFLKQMVHVG